MLLAPVSAQETYTSQDRSFRFVPPVGWTSLSKQKVKNLLGHEQGAAFNSSPNVADRIWILIKWERLPDLPRPFELTEGHLTAQDQQTLRGELIDQERETLMEQPGGVGSCPAYSVLERAKEDGRLIAYLKTAYICENILFTWRVSCEVSHLAAATDAAQAAMDTFEFLGGAKVPYLSRLGGFAIVPPPGWFIFDFAGLKQPQSVVEFHAVEGQFENEDIFNYRFPWLRIMDMVTDGKDDIVSMSPAELKAVMKLELSPGVEVLEETTQDIGSSESYEVQLQRPSDFGEGLDKDSFFAFVSGGKMYLIRFRAATRAYDRLRSTVEESLQTFERIQ